MYIEDRVFGKLSFDTGWIQKQYVDEFRNEITFRVDCYENELPNDNQRNTYLHFKSGNDNMRIKEELIKYISEYITIPNDIFTAVTINELLLLDNGKYVIIFETVWDTHNSAMIIGDDIVVGTEDIISNYI